jgi:5'-nucleotidase
MHLLLTNDDGYDAEGLTALYAAAAPLGRITVVAPRRPWSAQSHAVTYGPIRVESVEHPAMGPVHVCDGTPADCVRLALTVLTTEPVDWVLSGINCGANIGTTMLYSGTVAAAREAAVLGSRGMAFSQYVRDEVDLDWERARTWVAHLLPQLLARHDAPGVTWNVNLPLSNVVSPRARVVPMTCASLPMEFEAVQTDVKGATDYRYCGDYSWSRIEPDMDVAAVFDGDIAITPIGLDATTPQLLDASFDSPAS